MIADAYAGYEKIEGVMQDRIASERYSALAAYADFKGIISLDTVIHKNNVYEYIAKIVKEKVSQGIKSENICVIVPQWNLLYPISRNLRTLLPDVEFDAPDMSPIKADDSIC